MGYSNLENKSYLSSVSMGEDKNGADVDVRTVTRGSMFVVWTGASATNATVKAQRSHDGTNWQDISGASVTIGAAAGAAEIPLKADDLLAPLVRAVFTKNAETTGTFSVSTFFKGER